MSSFDELIAKYISVKIVSKNWVNFISNNSSENTVTWWPNGGDLLLSGYGYIQSKTEIFLDLELLKSYL